MKRKGKYERVSAGTGGVLHYVMLYSYAHTDIMIMVFLPLLQV